MNKATAHCTCTRSDSIFNVVMKTEGIEFEAAKVRVAEIIGRTDLIRKPSSKGSKFDAESLLSPPDDQRDDVLPLQYLAHRLGVALDDVPVPATPFTGWSELDYYDPPAGPRAKPKRVGAWPCVVFGALSADGVRHAHRIYVEPEGAGKANLGKTSRGKRRDPKKSAQATSGASSTGCAVHWGDPDKAPHIILSEGIETAAAIAYAMRAAIERDQIAVAAGISANGVESFQPFPETDRITVAADRDEDKPASDAGYKRGERAAREFALRHDQTIYVAIAVPGKEGESCDYLDVFQRDGTQAVAESIEAAVPFKPTAVEIAEAGWRAKRDAELAKIEKVYPLPMMETVTLEYRRTRNHRVMVHKVKLQQHPGTGEDRELATPVATPFGITARLRYANKANAYGVRVLVQDMEGRHREVDIERAALARTNASEVRAALLAAGLRTEGCGESLVIQAIKAVTPDREIIVVSRLGWYRLEDSETLIFVAPDGTIQGAPDGVSIELAADARPRVPMAAGTIEGWKEATAAALSAPGCPHLTIGVLAGFAGLILALAGLDTCGINLSGRSSVGKTMSQRLAVSIWSSPNVDEGLLQTLRATDNAIEALAARSSGTVLALDEISHVDGKMLARLIYSMASGVGKARQRADSTLRQRYSWQTFVILSGESSLEEKVRGDGGVWQAGMMVRIADIGVSAVNNALPAEVLGTIDGIRKHHGHAGPAFCQRIVERGLHKERDKLREEILSAARKMAGTEHGGAGIRAALPFAIMVVAGDLAKEVGLLPADADIRGAVEWAWGRFRDSSDALALAPADLAIANMRLWIAEKWDVTIRKIGATAGSREVVGWYDERHVYIPTSRIREAAGNVLAQTEIARELASRNVIGMRGGRDRLSVRYIRGVGHVSAYALRLSEVGRIGDTEEITAK
ncbi:MAG: DUF927 domain-containing protein [Proteobacteria bacterium]|nr:DUF927 domain-containing protein [Pseudomonadota bacterium]